MTNALTGRKAVVVTEPQRKRKRKIIRPAWSTTTPLSYCPSNNGVTAVIIFASSHKGQTTNFSLVAISHSPCFCAQPSFEEILLSHDNHDQKTEDRPIAGWGDTIPCSCEGKVWLSHGIFHAFSCLNDKIAVVRIVGEDESIS